MIRFGVCDRLAEKIEPNFETHPRCKYMLMLDFVENVIRTNRMRRIDLVVIGLFRFLRCIEFSQENLATLSNYNRDMSRLLIAECGFPIRKELFDLYIKKFPHVVKFRDNMFLTEDFEDFYHAQLYYEKSTLEFVLGNLSLDEIFVDIGANIGGYAIRTARKARKVYAFEPDVRNFSLLEKNVRLNNLHNIDIRNTAVGDYVGKVKLHFCDYHGRSSIIGQGEYVEVDCVNLDSVLEEEDKIGIVKIDVEGAEALVLKGAEDTIKRTKIVVVEIQNPESSKSHLISEYLTKYGYTYVERRNPNSIFVNKQDFKSDQIIGRALRRNLSRGREFKWVLMDRSTNMPKMLQKERIFYN